MSSETSRQLIWSVKQRRREGVLGRQVITRERKTRCVIISTVPSRVSLAWGPLEPSEPWSMTKLLQISDFPVLSLLHGLVPWYLHEQRSQDATTLCLSTLATKTLCLPCHAMPSPHPTWWNFQEEGFHLRSFNSFSFVSYYSIGTLPKNINCIFLEFQNLFLEGWG